MIGPADHRVRCSVCRAVVRSYPDEPHTAIVHDGSDGRRCAGSPGGAARHAAIREAIGLLVAKRKNAPMTTLPALARPRVTLTAFFRLTPTPHLDPAGLARWIARAHRLLASGQIGY